MRSFLHPLFVVYFRSAFLCLAFVFSFTELWSDQFEDFSYEVIDRGSGDEISITGYLGIGGDLSIPSEILGKPVTAIGERAFYFNSDIIHLTIPDTVLFIERHAFYGCEKLESVSWSKNLVSIGTQAFVQTSLTQLIFPSSLRRIEYGAFSIPSISEIILNNGVEFLGNEAFMSTGISDIYIPSTLSSIGGNFLKNCQSLLRITVAIENNAFAAVDNVLYSKDLIPIIV